METGQQTSRAGGQTSKVQVMGIDAGGTMTDTFFVREDGRFVVGKAQSNPEDESLAIYNSSQDALAHWNRTVDDVYPELVRRGEAAFKENYEGRELSDEQWVDALIAHPILIERPIVVRGDLAVIGRPTEKVLELLDADPAP